MIWTALNILYSAVEGVLYFFFQDNSWDIIFFKSFFSLLGLLHAGFHLFTLAKTLIYLPRPSTETLEEYRRKRQLLQVAQEKRPSRSLKLKLFYYVVPCFIITSYGANLRQRLRDALAEEEAEVPYIREVKWVHRLENGALLLKNGTQVFENDTRIYYNGTIRYPDGRLVHQTELNYFDFAETKSYLLEERLPYCGIRSERYFRPWSEAEAMAYSEIPLLLPKNVEELADTIRHIGDSGCVVRPVAAGHSMDNFSAAPDNFSVAVSLALFQTEDPSWALSSPETLELVKVRAEGGKTLADMYAVIRPLGFFLGSHPSSWAISVGSIAVNPIYGGTFGSAAVNSFISRLRVMLANGTITELHKEEDLRMWRRSMGLLGIVIGAEFELVRRANFLMGYRSYTFSHWNRWVLDEVVSNLLPGTIGAHYLFDPSQDKILGIGYVDAPVKVKEQDCTWSLFKFSCSEHCQYEFRFGDILPRHSCRLKNHYKEQNTFQVTDKYYRALSQGYLEDLRLHGLPTAGITVSELPSIVRRTVSKLYNLFTSSKKSSLDEFMKDIDFVRGTWNDGFWEVGMRKLAWIHYSFQIQWIFSAIDVYRQYLHELEDKGAVELRQLLHYPLEIHFFKDTARHQGHLVGLIVRATSAESSHMRLFAELERRWREIPSAFPVPTGSFGFNEVDGIIGVDLNITCTLLHHNEQIEFLRYKQRYDPQNYLWGGRATLLFNQTLKKAADTSEEELEAFEVQDHMPILAGLFGS